MSRRPVCTYRCSTPATSGIGRLAVGCGRAGGWPSRRSAVAMATTSRGSRPALGEGPGPAALSVRAEEVDQDGGDYLGRGVVVVPVEHLEQRTWRGSGLFRDGALEPGRAVFAAKNKDGRGDLPQLGCGYPARGDGEVVGERGGQGLHGSYPRGTVHLREHFAWQPDDLGHPEGNGLVPAAGADQLANMIRRTDGRRWRVLVAEWCLVRDDARDRQAGRGGPQCDCRAG